MITTIPWRYPLVQGMADGPDVGAWQRLLMRCGVGSRLAPWGADGNFGNGTKHATNALRNLLGQPQDPKGTVTPELVRRAEGYAASLPFPLPPVLNMQLAERDLYFGKFQWSDDDGDGWIKQDPEWCRDNLVTITIPQLDFVVGYRGKISCHRKVAPAIQGVMRDIERAGKIKLILTYGGCHAARRIRTPLGFSQNLSDHAWAIAFDFNEKWNGLGAVPAPKGSEGSVVELLPYFYDWGFYCGGAYKRQDAMHFTLADLDRVAFKLGTV